MKKLIYTTAMLSLLAATANAGIREGHGGDAIVCYDRPLYSESGEVDPKAKIKGKPELKDYWEFDDAIPADEISLGGDDLDYIQKVEYILTRLETVDHLRASRLRKKFEDPMFYALMNRVLIKEINDSPSAVLPVSRDGEFCYERQLAMRIKNPKPRESQVKVDNYIFQKLTEDHKAGLIMHELLYDEEIRFGAAKNSNKARWFNYIISSDYIDKLTDVQDGYSETYTELIENQKMDYANKYLYRKPISKDYSGNIGAFIRKDGFHTLYENATWKMDEIKLPWVDFYGVHFNESENEISKISSWNTAFKRLDFIVKSGDISLDVTDHFNLNVEKASRVEIKNNKDNHYSQKSSTISLEGEEIRLTTLKSDSCDTNAYWYLGKKATITYTRIADLFETISFLKAVEIGHPFTKQPFSYLKAKTIQFEIVNGRRQLNKIVTEGLKYKWLEIKGQAVVNFNSNGKVESIESDDDYSKIITYKDQATGELTTISSSSPYTVYFYNNKVFRLNFTREYPSVVNIGDKKFELKSYFEVKFHEGKIMLHSYGKRAKLIIAGHEDKWIDHMEIEKNQFTGRYSEDDTPIKKLKGVKRQLLVKLTYFNYKDNKYTYKAKYIRRPHDGQGKNWKYLDQRNKKQTLYLGNVKEVDMALDQNFIIIK